jgi:hypothetical protein
MSGLNYGTFYEVGNTGLYLGGGREGGFVIVFKENNFFYDTIAIEGCCDCIESIYEGIKEFAPCLNINLFLIKYEWLIRETAKKLWDDMSGDYIFPKCFDCTLKKKKTTDNCSLLCGTSWSYERPYHTIPEFDEDAMYEKVNTFLKFGYDWDLLYGDNSVKGGK